MKDRTWWVVALTLFFLVGLSAVSAGKNVRMDRELTTAKLAVKTAMGERDNADLMADQWEKQYREALKEIAELKRENERLEANIKHMENQIEELTHMSEEAIYALDEMCYENGWQPIGTFRITHYCDCPLCCGQWSGGPTASGVMPEAGRTIAVDPSVIPLGSEVCINGHVYVAEDTGVSGSAIDIFVNDHQEALRLGLYYADVEWRAA